MNIKFKDWKRNSWVQKLKKQRFFKKIKKKPNKLKCCIKMFRVCIKKKQKKLNKFRSN